MLKCPQTPAVLLEARSIINRGQELLMGTPEHQAAIAAAVIEAAEGFCGERRPLKSDRIAHPDAAGKPRLRPRR